MKKVSLMIATLCAGLSISSMASAQQFKVGVVNVDRLLAESNQAKSARSQLESQFKSRDASLSSKAASIRSKNEQYEKDYPTLTDAQREGREKALKQEIDGFETERAKFESDYATAQNNMMQTLLGKADALVKSIAQKEGYDLVVTEAAYVKAEYDLTPKLIEGLK
ncbi:MAG: OmpH family outer membrane protein [Formosimonas sp.]|jgi:outer membrane protein